MARLCPIQDSVMAIKCSRLIPTTYQFRLHSRDSILISGVGHGTVMRTIEDIVSDILGLVHEAHEIGKDEGAAVMRANLAAFLQVGAHDRPTTDNNGSATGTTAGASTDSQKDKAQKGTVKPGIVKLINDTPAGLTQDEIIERTGFKSNSVRGTLYTILTEGLVQRRSGRYFPLGGNGEGSDATAPEPS
jgi:hypothetical protein